MILKKQSEFTEKERIHFVAELWNDIHYNGKELRLEVTSSNKSLVSGGEHDFYTQSLIWDNTEYPKIVYHNLYKQTLTNDQCLEICNNIGENPEKFLDK